jgi:hypothetical protein
MRRRKMISNNQRAAKKQVSGHVWEEQGPTIVIPSGLTIPRSAAVAAAGAIAHGMAGVVADGMRPVTLAAAGSIAHGVAGMVGDVAVMVLHDDDVCPSIR